MAATDPTQRRALLGIPREVIFAVGWFAAVPWIIVAGRSWRSGIDLVDALLYPLLFWVTFPAWLMSIIGRGPQRAVGVTAVYAGAGAVPFVVLVLLAQTRGVLTIDLLGSFAIAWALATSAGLAFGWLALQARVRSQRWHGRGVIGRVWSWEGRQWWTASLVAVTTAALASPVLLALSDAPARGAAIMTMIAAATMLAWVIDCCDVDRRVLLLEVGLSLPVMIASIAMVDPNAVVVLVLGVGAPVVLAGVVSQWCTPGEGDAGRAAHIGGAGPVAAV